MQSKKVACNRNYSSIKSNIDISSASLQHEGELLLDTTLLIEMQQSLENPSKAPLLLRTTPQNPPHYYVQHLKTPLITTYNTYSHRTHPSLTSEAAPQDFRITGEKKCGIFGGFRCLAEL